MPVVRIDHVSDPALVEQQLDRVKAILRKYWYQPGLSLSRRQRMSSVRKIPKTGVSVSQVSWQVSDQTLLRKEVLSVIGSTGQVPATLNLSDPTHCTGEWIGFTASAATQDTKSEKEKFETLSKEQTRDMTILYVHGGGFIQDTPAMTYKATTQLSKLTGARCFASQYRLSPQNVFPAALYDTLLAYLYLLYPPADAFHEPVSAERIVLAGDSAGATLCIALVQLLLGLRRKSGRQVPLVWFDQKLVSLPIPAGLASVSAYCDCTDSFPADLKSGSCWISDFKGYNASYHQSDEIWPKNPPRVSIYCDDDILCHPIASVTACEDWAGAPPLWLAHGDELVAGSNRFLAQQAANQEVKVVHYYFERVPHCWHILNGLENIPQAVECFRSCAEFCVACVEDPASIRSEGRTLKWGTWQVQTHDVYSLIPYDLAEVRRRMEVAAKVWIKSLEKLTGVSKI